MAVINMSKNQKISMTKEDGSAVKTFFIGVNWEENRYAGESDIDFDINGLSILEIIEPVMMQKELHLMENILMNILLFMLILSLLIELILLSALQFSELFRENRILVWLEMLR